MVDNFVLIVLTAFVLGCGAIDVDRILKLREPDPALRTSIQRASWEISADINNIAHTNFNEIGQKQSFPDAKFDDLFLEIDEEKFVLYNLEILGVPITYFNRAKPDFLNGVLQTELKWENVVVEGIFERYIKSAKSNIGIPSGTLRLTWDQIKSAGNVAFLPATTEDGFYSTNFDLDFQSRSIQLDFTSDRDGEVKSINIPCTKLKSHIEGDLFWKLENNLPQSVDSFLQTLPVSRVFNSNLTIANQYTAYMQDANDIMNNFADEIIRMVKEGVNESGFWKFKLPDIREEFSKKFMFITFWGHLALWNGEAQDLRSLKRRNSFSLVVDDDTYEITGEAELTQLTAKYQNYQAKIWNIGPSGTVAVSARNAFAFKIKAIRDQRSLIGFRVLSHNIKVHIDNIKIDATGLGAVFNWLLSLIASCVANSFKGEISWLIEDNINQAIENILPLVS